MWLQQLEIKAHPRFAPCTLRFHKGLNAVLGKNGTGKTSLLKLLVDVASADFELPSTFADAAEQELDLSATFQTSDGFRFDFALQSRPAPASTIPQRHADRVWHLRFEATLDERRLRLELHSDAEATCSIDGEAPMPTGRRTLVPNALDVWATLQNVKFLDTKLQDDAFVVALGQALTNNFWKPRLARFDEALETFDQIISPKPPLAEHADRLSSSVLVNSSAPRQMRAVTPARISERLLLGQGDTEQLEFRSVEPLPTIAASLDATEVKAVPRWVETTVAGDREMQHYDGWDFRIKFANSGTVLQKQLSFGQKRLLAFYWYLACIPDGIVIADELTNGFHHAWIEGALREIGDRQAILATQSPLLLDYLEFESAEQVERSFVLCSLETTKKGRRFRLSNPTPEQAQRFMAALQTGHQYVNEILQNLGLW